MATTKTNNLGAVQNNLTAAYNARKKRDDLWKKGYAVSPDKAKRDEYAAVGAEMDSNYNAGFQEIRRLEEEAKNRPAFTALTDADNERWQKIRDIKKQIPLPTRLAQELLPKGLVRSREIAPLQEGNENFKEVKSALIKNEFQKQQAPVSENFKKAKDILVQESINQNEGQNKDQVNDATIEDITSPRIKESNSEAVKPSGRLYRVMLAGKGADTDEVYETKEEADAALKKAGGKGAVAGVNFSEKNLGVELPPKETQARKQRYIDQLNKSKSDKTAYEQNLKRIQSPEYRAEVQERLRLANEAKLTKDRAEGAKAAKWHADVDARRGAVNYFNQFNSEMGMMQSAYKQAQRSKEPLLALAISQAMRNKQGSVPKEMGARMKYFEQNAVGARDAMLAREKERLDRLASANPDARDLMP